MFGWEVARKDCALGRSTTRPTLTHEIATTDDPTYVDSRDRRMGRTPTRVRLPRTPTRVRLPLPLCLLRRYGAGPDHSRHKRPFRFTTPAT